MRPMLSERFWAKVDKNGPTIRAELGQCWEWTATRTIWGYGQFWIKDKYQQAHRVAWLIAHGSLPSLDVLHHCDNRKCVRIGHLFLGDDRLNARDKMTKGRQTKGEAINTAKLNSNDVLVIRRRLAQGESQSALAHAFHVTPANVSEIARGRTWKHLLRTSGCS